MEKEKLIYLDNASTTRVDDRVIEAMYPFFSDLYANPSSSHKFGVEINNHIKEARERIAGFLNCEPYDLVFTSGATEALNLAIKGVSESLRKKGNHIITLSTEHDAVLDTCKYLQTVGYDVTYLPVKNDGLIDIEQYQSAFQQNTILTVIMYANNEIGVIQPIKELAEISHSKGVLFLTDATQAIGKLSVNVKELDVDLLAFSGHKFHGPKGIGGLIVRKEKRVKPIPLIHGGHQEMNLRSGTLNVPSIVGMCKAFEIAYSDLNNNSIFISKLRNSLEKGLLTIEGSRVNGNSEFRVNNISNILFNGIDSDAIISGLSEIAVSKGSACSSQSTQPSHVLKALGLTDNDAYSSIRFSLSKYNTEEEIDRVIIEINSLIKLLSGFNH